MAEMEAVFKLQTKQLAEKLEEQYVKKIEAVIFDTKKSQRVSQRQHFKIFKQIKMLLLIYHFPFTNFMECYITNLKILKIFPSLH